MSFTEIEKSVVTFTKDKLEVRVFSTREEMGKQAAIDVAKVINENLERKEGLNMIFAAAPSQQEFMQYLTTDESIKWEKVNAFHMDEYIGLEIDAPQGFGNFLKNRLFSKVPFKSVNYINGQASDPEKECERYSDLLKNNSVDIVCLGIGENGHIAFNDPSVADFNDPKSVKVVELDMECRQQQVNEGLFANLDLVPKYAITVTIPQLLKADLMFCMVPATNKAQAVFRTLNDVISEKCPATILRSKDKAILYLDNESASLLDL